MKTSPILNQPIGKKLLLEDASKTTTSKYDLNESRMFIFYWAKDEIKNKANYLRGLDSNGNVIYEEQIAGF